MGWGMTGTITTDEDGRTFAEHDLWVQFMEQSIQLDGDKYPQGWHWFLSLAYLLSPDIFDIKDMQNKLLCKHPFKSLEIPKWRKNHPLKNKIKPLQEKLMASKNDAKKEDIKIDLSKLHFTKLIDFSNFIFPVEVVFNESKFSEDANFINTRFLKNVLFNNAVFCETADFKDAIFHENTSHYKETAKFRNTTFEKIANFKNATFWGYANFKGSKLKGRAFFQDADFKYHAPRFYDATFNNEITWTGIQLPNFDRACVDYYNKVGNVGNIFERTNDEEDIKKNHRRRIEENQNSYENTSILLKEANRYHDQHFFFRHEMRCRRWLGNFFNCSLYWLYQLSADYGYGVKQALICWTLHIILGVAALMFFISPCWEYTSAEFWKILDCAMPVSFANANPYTFFGFESKKLESCYEMLEKLLPIGSGVIQIVQSIAGTLFLFLLLLTLRVRFRLGGTTNNTTINLPSEK